MKFEYNIDELSNLMTSFYKISGIRYILFDTDFNKIISVPADDCLFCKLMKENAETAAKCLECDKRSLNACKNSNMVLYKCHAGLLEAAVALKSDDRIVGYMMFGQIADRAERNSKKEQLAKYCEAHNINREKSQTAIDKTIFKTNDQIYAASKIMEVCTSYILSKELIIPKGNLIFDKAKEYIENHLSENFDISVMCAELNISRTRLYELFRQECSMGVSSYLRRRRMHKAKKLLKETDLPIWEVSARVGFEDYNYFSRVYKKIYGKSPIKIRKGK